MSEDIKKTQSAPKSYSNDNSGAISRNYPLIGIVKNNVDSARAGRLQVYIADFGVADEDDSSNWVKVDYLSPFCGTTPNTAPSDGYGEYVSNPQSYGMWATPPDKGTEVLCIFVNGDINFGYYIGCIPKIGQHHMIPAIGASSSVIVNDAESKLYGGAGRLPVSELNLENSQIASSPDFNTKARPAHSHTAATFHKQGLIRDSVRGPISSSSSRESPSRVFGISTPGRPIYSGGYTDETISSTLESASDQQVKVIGRRTGHSIVMDDGDIDGNDQLIRLRTSSGHQIMMNDSSDVFNIMHASGKSWVEFGKEGTVDIYSMNSLNARSQGDINFHADRNINFHAGGSLNLYGADAVGVQSGKSFAVRSGGDSSFYTVGNYTVKADSSLSLKSAGEASIAAGGACYVNGSRVNLNTGNIGLTPQTVKPFTMVSHSDTKYTTNGYMPETASLSSIVSRAPAHHPWVEADYGVDVKVDMSVASSDDSLVGTGDVGEVVPDSVVATIPPVEIAGVSPELAQHAVAVSAAATTAAGSVASSINGAVKVGPLGLSPSQLELGGVIKPGTASIIAASGTIPSAISTGAVGKNLTVLSEPAAGASTLAKSLSDPTAIAAGASKVLPTQTAQAKTLMGGLTKGGSPLQAASAVANSALTAVKAKLPFGGKIPSMPDILSKVPTMLKSVSLLAAAKGMLGKVAGLAGITGGISKITGAFGKISSLSSMTTKLPTLADATAKVKAQTDDVKATLDKRVQPPKV